MACLNPCSWHTAPIILLKLPYFVFQFTSFLPWTIVAMSWLVCLIVEWHLTLLTTPFFSTTRVPDLDCQILCLTGSNHTLPTGFIVSQYLAINLPTIHSPAVSLRAPSPTQFYSQHTHCQLVTLSDLPTLCIIYMQMTPTCPQSLQQTLQRLEACISDIKCWTP